MRSITSLEEAQDMCKYSAQCEAGKWQCSGRGIRHAFTLKMCYCINHEPLPNLLKGNEH